MKRIYKTFTLTAAFLLFAATGISAVAGERVSASVAEPVTINGETFPAGTIVIKEIRDYSPGVTMNEIRIGGRSVGMILARADDDAPVNDRSALIFTRDETGTLVLESVAIRNQPVRQLMAFRSVDGQGQWYVPADGRVAGTLVAALN